MSLSVTDHYPRYSQAYPTKDEKATTVAMILWEAFIETYGVPEELHSDHGRCFESAVVHEFANFESRKCTQLHSSIRRCCLC